jgi:hypothetical protein
VRDVKADLHCRGGSICVLAPWTRGRSKVVLDLAFVNGDALRDLDDGLFPPLAMVRPASVLCVLGLPSWPPLFPSLLSGYPA